MLRAKQEEGEGGEIKLKAKEKRKVEKEVNKAETWRRTVKVRDKEEKHCVVPGAV